MIYAAIIAGLAALAALGVLCYRSGSKYAENIQFKNRERENEQMDEILRVVSVMGRDECLRRLRGGKK